MSVLALIVRLRRRLGLDPESIGLNTLQHGIDEACATLGAADVDDLLARVERNERDWQRFVDCMVVPETWLFRVPEQFDDLLRHVRAELSERRPVRILSLPCASGEEVYSIAASLANAGYASGSFEILGIDVSERAIETARQARYRSSALRGRAADLNWFEWQDDQLLPAPTLRHAVRFRVGNILHPGVFTEHERFDIIFCRNLLIYLDADARRTALDRLLGVLDGSGLILAGQAEVLSQMDPRLQPLVGYGPLSFTRSRDQRAPASPPAAPPRQPAPPARRQTPPAVAPRAPNAHPPSAPARTASSDDLLEPARRHADAGALAQARSECHAVLAIHPESVPAWYLLGMIEMAGGALDDADQAFARASFLDRDHRDALQHRAALADRLGRPDQAARLRSRLQRLAIGVSR
jgi:chemotaxis protein methyltransferase WspC